MLFASALLLVLIRTMMIPRFDLLHGWWRYTGMSGALDVAKCVFLGSLLFILATQYLTKLTEFPGAIYKTGKSSRDSWTASKAGLFLGHPDDIRARIKKIVSEYSYVSINQSPEKNDALWQPPVQRSAA